MPEKTEKTWNEWSLKVLEQLVALNTRQEQLADEIKEKHDALQCGIEERHAHLERKIDKTNELLTGNGDPSKGLLIRVDRLEQNEGRRTWLLRACVTACLGAVLATIINYLKSQN